MADREKVIKKLTVRIQSDSEEWNTIELPIEEAKEILSLLKEQKGLMLALGQSNAANEYLNTEVERLTELLKEQQTEIEDLRTAMQSMIEGQCVVAGNKQQPKTARWEKRTGMMPPEYHGHYWCSNCDWHGKYNEREADYKFCPSCGAEMTK